MDKIQEITKMRQYVLSIISDNYNEGCGVMVGDMFITAGHVIYKCVNPSIRWNGKKIPLINPIVFHNDENDSDSYDIAVYSIPNANSPLILSDVVPPKGDVLKSCSWRFLGEEYVECNAVVNGLKEGNYYAAETDEQLKPGSSGSPVFLNGEVVGILCAGNYKNVNAPCNSELPLNLCVFLSSKVILELLEKNRFQ